MSGILGVPSGAAGVVGFAHGSGSGRFSPRNQFVARVLEEGGLATLLLDLLEDEEADDQRKVFHINVNPKHRSGLRSPEPFFGKKCL